MQVMYSIAHPLTGTGTDMGRRLRKQGKPLVPSVEGKPQILPCPVKLLFENRHAHGIAGNGSQIINSLNDEMNPL